MKEWMRRRGERGRRKKRTKGERGDTGGVSKPLCCNPKRRDTIKHRTTNGKNRPTRLLGYQDIMIMSLKVKVEFATTWSKGDLRIA